MNTTTATHDTTTATVNDGSSTATLNPPAEKKAKTPKIKKSHLTKKIGYFMLTVPDMTKAIEFYKSIGLKATMESPEWTEFKAGIKFALHGMTKGEGACSSSASESACSTSQGASKPAATRWTGIVFNVKNCDKSYGTFQALGVKVLGAPKQVCDEGRSFEFEDPFGNVLSCYGK